MRIDICMYKYNRVYVLLLYIIGFRFLVLSVRALISFSPTEISYTAYTQCKSSTSAPTVCSLEQVSDLHRAPVCLALTIPPSSANGDVKRVLVVSKLQSFSRKRASVHTATKSARSPMPVTFGTQRSTLITRPPLRWDACFCKAIVTEAARDLAAVDNSDYNRGASTCSVTMTSLL